MKRFVLIAALAASATQGYIIPPQPNAAPDWSENEVHTEDKRQIVGTLTWLMGKGGKVADPPGAAPRRQVMKSDSKVPGAKRIKIRSGPYSVPNMNKTSVVGEQGMLWNYPDTKIDKPCTECTIIRQWAGLEYPDGRNANIDTGMWLHHMVHLTIGPGRSDPTCIGKQSLPHVDVNASPSNAERYFSSGNERTVVTLDVLGLDTKWGYHIKASDKFAYIVDLMNMNMQDKTVYVTMYYEILDGRLPPGWEDIKVVWFDAANCGTSEVRPAKENGAFVVRARPWKPNFEGRLLGVGGHVHDGGVDLQVMYSPKDELCNSRAAYAENKQYISFGGNNGGMGSHMTGLAMNHISSMTACYVPKLPITHLKRSQEWQITARYDYNKFAGNKDKGKQSTIMAIALMYVAIPANGVSLSGGGGGGGNEAPARGAPARGAPARGLGKGGRSPKGR